MQKIANRVSLGAVHTHTHTSTFREIRRVANEAALFGVENRLFVALYEGKNKVLEIACFFVRRKFIPVGEIFVQHRLCRLQRISLQFSLFRNSCNVFFAWNFEKNNIKKMLHLCKICK